MVGELLLEQKFSPSMNWDGVSDAGTSFLLGSVVNFTVTFIITYHLALIWIKKRREKASHLRKDLVSTKSTDECINKNEAVSK